MQTTQTATTSLGRTTRPRRVATIEIMTAWGGEPTDGLSDLLGGAQEILDWSYAQINDFWLFRSSRGGAHI